MLRISNRAIVLLIVILVALWIGAGTKMCTVRNIFEKDTYSFDGSSFTMKTMAADTEIIEADTDRVKLVIDGRTEYLEAGKSTESRKAEHVTVTIPMNLDRLKAETVSGGISAYGLTAGETELSSVSGSVNGSDKGQADSVTLETVSGSINFESHSKGDLTAQSVSGSINVSTDAENVKTNSVSGSIDIDTNGHDYGLSYSTISGTWTYRNAGGGGKGSSGEGSYGHINAETVSGSINID